MKTVDQERKFTARLSSDGPYTVFSCGDERLKFRAPLNLKRYLRVRKWDNGYLEVDADYGQGAVEEYIDLFPVLKCLRIAPTGFLKSIKNVEVAYA